ncbi:MAG: hypothetical protein AAGG01_04285 [Planctomycetota bacterium]
MISTQRASDSHPTLSRLPRATPGFVLAVLVAALLLFGLGACSSTNGSASPDVVGATEDAWLQPSPALRRDIEVKAIEVAQISTMDDFLRLSDWFQGIGEVGYPKLLELATSPDQTSRRFAINVISARRDPRLLEPLKAAAPISGIAGQEERYDMARALLKLGDMSGVSILIDGLESPSLQVRVQAHKALEEGTNAGISYHAAASQEERDIAVQAWRDWHQSMSTDEMLLP